MKEKAVTLMVKIAIVNYRMIWMMKLTKWPQMKQRKTDW